MRLTTFGLFAAVSLAGIMLLANVAPFALAPDCCAWVVVFWALYSREQAAVWPIVVLGAMRDVLSLTPLGCYAMAYWLVFILIHPRRQHLFRDTVRTQFIVVFLATLVVHVLMLVPLLVDNHHPPRWVWFTPLAAAAITGITAPLVFGVTANQLRRAGVPYSVAGEFRF